MRVSKSLGKVGFVWMMLCATALAATEAADLVDVVKQVEASVVRINTDAGVGSGVVVAETGLVITNYHVIEGASRVEVELRNGKRLSSTGYQLVDPTHDLAVLRTAALPAGSAIKVANELPPVGTKVAAFGNPKGFSFTTSEGIVSAVRTGSEVQQTIGAASYRFLGYALDATWVQTTAAISPGNSGGPLVTMDCELVGLNTWNRTDGQQLNFAISIVDIKRALAKISSRTPVKGFDSLPKVRSTPVAGDWYEPLLPFRLELPTGRVFAFEVFATDADKLHKMAAATPNHSRVVISHPNGAMFAAAGQHDGILHGLTEAQWDNREPMVSVSYDEGRRHGVLKTWNEAGDPVVFAQYERGRRHGFTCLFDECVPVMIAQYKSDQLEYLQLMSALTPLEGFNSEDAALKNTRARSYLERLEILDKELKKNEFQFRRQVKMVEVERRRALAAKLAPEKRARASARAKARADAADAFMQGVRRRAYGF